MSAQARLKSGTISGWFPLEVGNDLRMVSLNGADGEFPMIEPAPVVGDPGFFQRGDLAGDGAAAPAEEVDEPKVFHFSLPFTFRISVILAAISSGWFG